MKHIPRRLQGIMGFMKPEQLAGAIAATYGYGDAAVGRMESILAGGLPDALGDITADLPGLFDNRYRLRQGLRSIADVLGRTQTQVADGDVISVVSTGRQA